MQKIKPSKANSLSKQDLQRWGMNFVKFVAPTLAVFFGQLAGGVPWKLALPVACIALWQSLADLFGKYKAGEK